MLPWFEWLGRNCLMSVHLSVIHHAFYLLIYSRHSGMPIQVFSDDISVKIFWPWPCDPRRPCPQRFESWSYETETSIETHHNNNNNNNLIKFIYRESIMIFFWKDCVFLCLYQSHTWLDHLRASQKALCFKSTSWCLLFGESIMMPYSVVFQVTQWQMHLQFVLAATTASCW